MYNIVLLMTIRMLYFTSSELTYLITGILSFLTTFTSPGGSDSKLSACSAGDWGSLPGLGRSPGGVHGKPLQYSCLENPHGQRNMVGNSLWACKESDTTEARTHTHMLYMKVVKGVNAELSSQEMRNGEGGRRGVQEWQLMYTRGRFMLMYGKTDTLL